jgi:hypothetical protein
LADLSVAAVCWVESFTASDEAFELGFQNGELFLAHPNLVQLGLEEGVDVGARIGAVAAQIEDAGDLDEGESGCLCAADKRQPGEGRGVVVTVPVGIPPRRGKKTLSFVEADGLRRYPGGVGDCSDTHEPILCP